jgi:hypothetical protein
MRQNSCEQFDSNGNSIWQGRACTLNGMPAKVVGRSQWAHRLVVETDDKSLNAEFTYSHVQKVMNRFRNQGQFTAAE